MPEIPWCNLARGYLHTYNRSMKPPCAPQNSRILKSAAAKILPSQQNCPIRPASSAVQCQGCAAGFQTCTFSPAKARRASIVCIQATSGFPSGQARKRRKPGSSEYELCASEAGLLAACLQTAVPYWHGPAETFCSHCPSPGRSATCIPSGASTQECSACFPARGSSGKTSCPVSSVFTEFTETAFTKAFRSNAASFNTGRRDSLPSLPRACARPSAKIQSGLKVQGAAGIGGCAQAARSGH